MAAYTAMFPFPLGAGFDGKGYIESGAVIPSKEDRVMRKWRWLQNVMGIQFGGHYELLVPKHAAMLASDSVLHARGI